MTLTIRAATTPADHRAFVDLQWALYGSDPHWVPPLKGEALGLIAGPKKNPWFEHARAAFFLAERDGKVVGRISAQVDDLVLEYQGKTLGQFGMFESIDDQAVADALIAAAAGWLRGQGMNRMQGPFSLSVWDEVGLHVTGFDSDPTIMMGHGLPYYERLLTAAGFAPVKDTHTWQVDITRLFPPLVQKIVANGEKNPRIRVRTLRKAQFDSEFSTILNILNDAWATNWGFVPLTPAEITHAGKKFKPIVFEDLIYLADYDGETVGFMIAVPDMNEVIKGLDGRLFPFGWIKLLRQLRRPRSLRIRVPLMGIKKKFQGSRTASTLAFMMIEYTRRNAHKKFHSTDAEIGWILEDNGPMRSIAEVLNGTITRTYRVFEKAI
ncbi:N-acetyltransferase [Sphingosinicellaceae bacterium]|nr:N-acetyltransferase [Sphingosinicellaceae bacterium]